MGEAHPSPPSRRNLMYRLPGDTDRHAIVGATGSGKTQYAQWELSNQNYTEKPWIVYDYKLDEGLNAIPGTHHIGLDELPKSPGVYLVHPEPDDFDGVEAQMRAITNRGNIGVYIDEGYMVGQYNPEYRRMLTQGRSLHVPTIVLSQRPAWMDRFTFSESSFIQQFRLQDKQDIDHHMRRYIPAEDRAGRKIDLHKRLPDYYSYYYDVSGNTAHILQPVPDIRTIHATFARRLRAKQAQGA
jgi:hypothetical protein